MPLLQRSAAAVLLTASFCAVPAHAASAWTNTATQGLTLGNLKSAVSDGAADPNTILTVRLALNLQNKAALLSYVKEINTPGSSLYGQSLTPAEFAAKYAPTSAQVKQVTSYLQTEGFSEITVEPNNLIVSAQATIPKVEAAFNTSILKFAQNGGTILANVTVAQVPTSLGGIVGAVLGLNTAGKLTSPLVTRSEVSVPQYDVSYNPTQFQEIYTASATPAASNASIAIMAEGDLTQVVKDLRTEESAYGLTQVPYTIVPVGLASTDTSGADEWDLDTQYSTGMAGTVKQLYIYDVTSLSDSDLALEFSRWATDDKAKAGSASLGECEIFPYLDGSMLADDNTFLEAAAQGQTFFASTGDTGSFCPAVIGENGVPAGAPLVNYPAASPYVVAVGGTTLLANANNTYNTEISWYAGGGGISQFESAPYWQTAADILSAEELGDRGLPDVAMDADPYSGANVYVDGAVEVVGGTSLSSPLALGVWARVLSAKSNVGFAPIKLYSLYDGATTPPTYPHAGFNDITIGTDGLYTALPGWDYTTGLGSFIVRELYNDLK